MDIGGVHLVHICPYRVIYANCGAIIGGAIASFIPAETEKERKTDKIQLMLVGGLTASSLWQIYLNSIESYRPNSSDLFATFAAMQIRPLLAITKAVIAGTTTAIAIKIFSE